MTDQTLIIDDELLDHLATQDGAMTIFKEHLDERVIPDELSSHRAVLRFTTDYINKYGQAPGQAVLTTEFGIEFQEPQSDVKWLISQLKERYVYNQAKDAITSATREIIGDDPEAAVDGLIGNLTRLKGEIRSHSYTLSKEDWSGVFREYQDKVAAGMLKGRTFGFEEIDSVLGGLRPGTLTYVIGRPKRYKSWFLLKSAVEEFLNGGNVDFWSLELGHTEMYGRFQCMVAGVSWNRYQKGILFPDEESRMREAGELIQDLDGRFRIHAPRGGVTVPEIRQTSRENEAELVVIDQLSWLRHTERVRSDLRHREVEYINYDLKEATSDFPIYIAAQFNREADSVDEMADLSKIGLSDSIGQISDMVMGLYRNKEMAKNNLIEFGTIESRGFEQARFEIKVNLSTESNFELITRTDNL